MGLFVVCLFGSLNFAAVVSAHPEEVVDASSAHGSQASSRRDGWASLSRVCLRVENSVSMLDFVISASQFALRTLRRSRMLVRPMGAKPRAGRTGWASLSCVRLRVENSVSKLDLC